MLWLRLALREIRNDRRFSVFFVVNLAIGLAGFVALDAFESSVSHELWARSQSFLGADLSVTSNAPFTDEQRTALDAAAEAVEISEGVQLFSMAGGAGRTRLVDVRAVDEHFPMYGFVVLDAAGPARAAERARLGDATGAWVDPALLSQLGIAVGDSIRIGTASFRVLDTVARDAGRATSGFSIAPRVYIDTRHLDSTGLVTLGSRVRHLRLFRLPPDAQLADTKQRMVAVTDDPRVSVRSHRDVTRNTARAYEGVASFLGLVSIIAVFLAGLGSAYLFRSFLTRRLRDLAILMSLGATRGRAQAIFLTQLWILALAAAALACGLGALLLPVAAELASEFLPRGSAPGLQLRTAALAALMAVVGSTAACLPLIVRIRELRPAQLFQEHAQPNIEGGARDFALLLPALLLFWGLAVWRVGDIEAGSLFVAIFGCALAGLAWLAKVGLGALAWLPRDFPLPMRLALRHLARSRGSTVSGFVAIALCALMVSLAPQLRAVLQRDIDPPGGSDLPSLFLFDIQSEQVEGLSALVDAEGFELQRISPMVRATLVSINGEKVPEPAPRRSSEGGTTLRQAREDEARRLRTRRYNLTYAAALTASEKLIEGRPFSGGHAGGDPEPAEMSLELHFAEELDVGLGDRMTFDVQGVPVEGRVVNLREVRWNSFQPNFFVSFQPGVLDAAPQTYLASVPRLPAEQRESLQASIVEGFPNISIIDVTRSVKRLLGLLGQLQWALTSTALLSLVVGLALVFAIARDQARARRWETNLLKVLGAEFRQVRAAVDIEFGLLALLATLSGVLCSAGAAALFADLVLDVAWRPAWGALGLPLVAIPLICVATSRVATSAVLRERPLALLQAAEG